MTSRVLPSSSGARWSAAIAVGLVGLFLASTPPAQVAAGPEDRQGGSRVIEGTVWVDGAVVQGTAVRLLAAGTTPESASVLHRTTTDSAGRFVLRVPSKVDRRDVLYVTARGGSAAGDPVPRSVELAASLADRRSGPVVVNERTTVAAGYSLAQFADAGLLGGASPGLQNAARMAWNLVDVETGAATRFLRTHPNGTATQTFASFNSLASIIAGCAARTNDCGDFLGAATDAWGVRPATTWQAMTLLPTNPSGDPTGVFDQIPADPRFRPVLSASPAAWVVALRFYGNGRQFNGPGNVAFDAQGRVWANNNAEWARLPRNVCPGLELYRLNPYAPGRPMQTYAGGGLNGAGFGIGIDPKRHVWVGDFGFTGSRCPTPPTSNSVSEFKPNGQPKSGDRGYLNGPLSWPQGTKSDVDGNIWIANCGNNSLVKCPNGQHQRSQVVSRRIREAFDVAQNTEGNIFVTANEGEKVFGFRPNGQPLPASPFGDSTTFAKPLGAASDSLGNVWVSNSGVIAIPCSTEETLEVPDPDVELDGSIVQVGADGSLAQFGGAGLTIPWGIAVDGDDNLWVANFSGERLSHLCGARVSTCPAGETGAPISPPDTGYAFDGLQRNTGVQVDSSGNVWLTNNWIKFPVQTDPFGDGLVVYLGMAAPVKTPLIGTPEQP